MTWVVTQKFSFCTNDLRYIYFFSGNKDVYLKKKEKKEEEEETEEEKREEEEKKRKEKRNEKLGKHANCPLFFADNCFTSPPPTLSTLANIIIIIFALRNLLSTFTDPPHHTFTFS